MSGERRPLLIAVGLTAAVALVVLALPRARRELAPEPRAAWVAIEVGAAGTAAPGPVRIAAGAPCTLHAVLEAEDWRGETIYFTEAPGLRLAGESVPVAQLRAWAGPAEAQVLWFSVEGTRPYVELGAGSDLSSLAFQEIYRPEWPRAWSIPCSVAPSSEAFARGVEDRGAQSYGTQRYHVRVEIFAGSSRIAPTERFQSIGAAQLPERVTELAAVIASLPGPLEVPSSVFGLAQVEPVAGATAAIGAEIARWTRQRLAFSRAAMMGEAQATAGWRWQDLRWRAVDLAAGPPWGGEGAAPGDLARVGLRVVVLAEDRGELGLLDREDLCFDYAKGPGLQQLAEVFAGDGLVEWAALSGIGEGAR